MSSAVPVPISAVTFGWASRLWYQAGLDGAPALDANTAYPPSTGMYIIGFTRSCPVLAPTVCRSSSGAPSNGPPTLPSLARNSSMILLFQSDISGTSSFSAAHSPGSPPGRSLAMRHRSTAASRGFIPAAEGTAEQGSSEPPGLRAEADRVCRARLSACAGLPACAGRGLLACGGRAGGAALAQVRRLDRAAAVGLALDGGEDEPDGGADDPIDVPVHRGERRCQQRRHGVVVVAGDRHLVRDAQAELAGGRVGAVGDGVGGTEQGRRPVSLREHLACDLGRRRQRPW